MGLELLFVATSPSWGGLEMNIIKLAGEMLKRGHAITFALNPSGRVYTEVNEDFEVVPIFEKEGFVSVVKKLNALFKSKAIDLIHVFYSSDLKRIAFSLFFSHRKIPVIFDPQIGIGVRKKDPFHRFIYKRVDAVIAISNDVRQGFVKNLPVADRKIHLISPGVETERFVFSERARRKVRDEFKISDEEILIGIVSRFSPGKGHEDLFKAFGIVLKEYLNVKLLVVGEPTVGEIGHAERLKALADELGISEHIIWTGFRRDIPAILSALDIFVAPSHAEAFGLSLVEAMSVGVPVIATRSAGFVEIVRDGADGFLFERGNYFELADKIKLLIEKPSLREKLSENAKLSAKRFDIKNYFDKIEKLYFELTENKQRGENVQHRIS